MRNFLKGAFVALLVASGAPVLAATVVTLTPATGHPNLPVTVAGSGFADGEAVDIYVDTADSLLAVSSAAGTIKASITMPAAAQPGLHYVTAIGRKSGDAAQATFTVSTSWAEDGFGAAHLGWNQYENTLNSSVVPSLELQWAAPESGEASAPIVVGGRVYIGTNTTGTAAGLYALNATTGALIWHATTKAGEQFLDSAAVSGGVIYIVGYTGIAYAFNASGKQLWSKQLGSSGQSSPVVVDGVIYVESGNNIYALNTNGTILWTAATAGKAVSDSLAVVNGRVFAASTDGNVYALNASTGAVLWTVGTGASVYGTPAVANGIVYVGSDTADFYALRAATGAVVWTATPGGALEGSAAVAGGVVYVPTGDGDLYAFNAASGAVLWSAPLSSAGAAGQVTVADGVVYVGDYSGNVTAFSAATGQYLTVAATGSNVFASPVVVNGMLYVSSNDGSLYAFAPGGAGADGLRRAAAPPALSSLHPDMQLVPVH